MGYNRNKKIIFASLFCIFAFINSVFVFSQDFYWENPVSITQKDSRFPSYGNSENLSCVFWQDIEKNNGSRGNIYISGKVYDASTNSWKLLNKIAGPFPYSGDIPNIFSVAVSDKNTISLAVKSSTDKMTVFTTTDLGENFHSYIFHNSNTDLIAPRIFKTSKNSFILFATEGKEDNFRLMFAKSPDGKQWSDFQIFTPTENFENAFVPVLTPFNNKDIVVCQSSFIENSIRSFQLFITETKDDGITWSEAKLISDSPLLNESQHFINFNNQRPITFNFENELYIAWERNRISSDNSQIYLAKLTEDYINGFKINEKPTMISSGIGNATNHVLFAFKDMLSILWFDARRGTDTIYLAQKNGVLWTESTLSYSGKNSVLPCPLITRNGKELNVFWQENLRNGSGKIVQLSPDNSVKKPLLKAYSYNTGKKSTAEKVSVKISFQEDSSGIQGYSWIFTHNQNEVPPKEFMEFPENNTLTSYATEDGKWYFKVIALDNAGNWSDVSSIMYEKDTTPPSKPKIVYPNIDGNGFVTSNTFKMEWLPGSDLDDDIAGYSYSLQYIGSTNPEEAALYQQDLAKAEAFSAENFGIKISPPPAKIMTSSTNNSWRNRDNGLYTFSVSAIDSVGNISESATVKLFLNKYIPYTDITLAKTDADDFGTISLNIYGRGFTYDGNIHTIYIDKDGKAPYDLILKKDTGDFKVVNDRRISGIELRDLDEGNYRIGLVHPERGLFMSGKLITVNNFGTVKLGDYSYKYVPNWKSIKPKGKFTIDTHKLVLWSTILFLLLGLTFSLRGIIKVTKEGIEIKQEVHQLLTGEIMMKNTNIKATELKKKGVGLRSKIIIFTATLIMMIIALVSVPLGYVMLNNQESTLLNGLYERINVLQESLASGAKTYLPQQNILELSYLPQQSTAIDEANYTTILGLPEDGKNTGLNFVWATNDKNILNKIDTKDLTYGKSKFADTYIDTLLQRCDELNTVAQENIGEVAFNISKLTTEAVSLALRTDKASVERREDLQTITRQLTEKLNITLNEYSKGGTSSIPEFNLEKLDRNTTTYTFYKPILYRQGSDQNFVRGLVLTEISTESLIKTIETNQRQILIITAIIAFLALAVGIALATFLASIIIKPIKKLVNQVNLIARTADKTKLSNQKIDIKSRDEIGELSQSVNTMTEELVENETNNQFLLGAKDVQRAFIPLDTDNTTGAKLSVGHMETGNSKLFCYYQGAKGVSGDYFDCKKIDEKHYAIIKCDVSGKGANAALIAAIVATLFKDYFNTWTYKKDKYELSKLAYKINDAVESLNLKGKFAAYTLCIFNTETNDFYFCNAGDNIINYFEAATKKKKTVILPETPPAGPFPSFMIEMKNGYPVEKIHLEKNDVLFLFTDGIEEAKRLYKNEFSEDVKFKPSTNIQINDKDDKNAVDGEEMGPERVAEIIEKVFAKETYILQKEKNPMEKYPEELSFDFSSCEGSPEEVVMALVAVEKVFRMYKMPSPTDFETVTVDKKVDAFLEKYFDQYNYYCSNKKEHPKKDYVDEYIIYEKLLEDEQFDDLTIIALKI